MEALSPTMEEGRLVKWVKNEGDAVKSGDVLAEVETDKAVMELVARADGVLRKRLLPEGESAPVGQLLGVIATKDENIDALVGGGGAAPAPAAAAANSVVRAPAPEPRPEGAGGGGAAAEEIVGETRERAGASPIPRSPREAQGDASMPPQEKMAGGRGAQMSGPVRHAR